MTLLPPSIALAGLGLLGLLVGSFLNVVIHRVPEGSSLLRPGSACPACAHPVRAYDNVPVLSWLMLRGRCRDCRTTISARYPAVELATGSLFVLAGWRFGDTPYLVAALALLAGGVALFAIDLDHQRLPFPISGVMAGIVVAAWVAEMVVDSTGPAARPASALLSAALWLAVYGGVWLLTTGRGMGLGDVALAPVLGLGLGWLGLGPGLVGLFAGFVIGALVGGGLLLTGRVGRRAKVPHGPFMLAGAFVGMFCGAVLWHGYLGLFGLA